MEKKEEKQNPVSLKDYEGKKVLVTGHTGFKGGWLCHWLSLLGAKVVGFSLPKEQEPSPLPWVFEENVTSYEGDMGDFSSILAVVKQEQPEIVFHLAAQPLVLRSYENPVETYQSNVMGTVHLCEAIRQNPCVKSFVNVTTDKVYENKEQERGYCETDLLDGYDPYSNSKSCSELVTATFVRSFFQDLHIPTSTMRAGNVIGGGDRSAQRILPDCIRGCLEKKTISMRNPHSVRPYQHVLEPLYAYLMVAMTQYFHPQVAGAYNVGPSPWDCVTTETMVQYVVKHWGEGASYEVASVTQPHEANLLRLDCTKLQETFSIAPLWSVEEAVRQTVLWEKEVSSSVSSSQMTLRQIKEYMDQLEHH